MSPSETEMNSLLVVETEVQKMMSTLKGKDIKLDSRTPLLAAAQTFFLLSSEGPSEADTSFASWEAFDEEIDRSVDDETAPQLNMYQMNESFSSSVDEPPVLTKETIENMLFGDRHDAHNNVQEEMNTSTMTALEPEEDGQDVLNCSTETALEPETSLEENNGFWVSKTMTYYHGMTAHNHQKTCGCQLCKLYFSHKQAWDQLNAFIEQDTSSSVSSTQNHVEQYEKFFSASNEAKRVYNFLTDMEKDLTLNQAKESVEEKNDKKKPILIKYKALAESNNTVVCPECGIRRSEEGQVPWLCCLFCDKAPQSSDVLEVKEETQGEEESRDSLLNSSTSTAIEPEEEVSPSDKVPETTQKMKKIVRKKDNQVQRWREQLQDHHNNPTGEYNDLLIKMREEMKSAWF